MRVKAEQFISTAFETAEGKAAFVNQFVSFAERGFPEKSFTQSLYEGLMGCFFHKAEANKKQFYTVWFSSTHRRLNWFCHALASNPLAHPSRSWSDVELALQDWIRTEKLIEQYQALYDAEVEQMERVELARLKAKYEK